jgi:hypothetical protein
VGHFLGGQDFEALHASVVGVAEDRTVGVRAERDRRDQSVELLDVGADAEREELTGAQAQAEFELVALFEAKVRVAAAVPTGPGRTSKVASIRNEIRRMPAPGRDEGRALSNGDGKAD